MIGRSAILAAVMFGLCLSVAGQERFVEPVDEAKLDRSFFAFRAKLIAAAERRDAKFILDIVDPDIKLSFGGESGIADFKRMWKVNDRSSEFWAEFIPVIKNGGKFLRSGGKRTSLFLAPYSFEGFPDDLDAFEHSVIFGKNVRLREAPGLDAKIIALLSYNIVKKGDVAAGGTPKWTPVTTLGGMAGYVSSEYVRSPIDYRAGFEKKRGRWKMVIFVAGD
ncbi:MAG: SH3 domain-containing protein [Pyrinomonadaceae bacterium]